MQFSCGQGHISAGQSGSTQVFVPYKSVTVRLSEKSKTSSPVPPTRDLKVSVPKK